MPLSPERTMEIGRLIFGPNWKPKPKPKPKVVTSEGVGVRDADVRVSPADPNAHAAVDGVVRVRRADFVTINFAAYERQQADKAADRQRQRELDPFRTGLWGPIDDE